MSCRKKSFYTNLIGVSFSDWTVLSFFPSIQVRRCIMFSCICICGNKSNIQSNAILNGTSKRCKACAARKHGFYKTPTYNSWSGASNRCFNKNNKDYKNYGGRGIVMCERWDNFSTFLLDMGEKPRGLSLDRINNEGNYEPSNCRWATPSQQSSNQRKRRVF